MVRQGLKYLAASGMLCALVLVLSGVCRAEVTPRIAVGGSHTVALLADGSVRSWGGNGSGQLGNGTTVGSPNPVPVSGLGEVVAIAAGVNHTVALLADGTVMAWGANAYGQLGNGTTTGSPVPVNVLSLGGTAIAIAAGSNHSVALLADGTVKCWGYNNYGQLGNGTNTSSATPVSVGSFSAAATAIAAGGSHTLALLADGTLRSWGYNNYGQLGNGTTSTSLSPVNVTGLGGSVAAIAAGTSHSLALMGDGTAKAWGLNSYGQLGNGNTTNSATPVAVTALGGTVVALKAGAYHSVALLNTGVVKTWGNNSLYQLGNGTTTNSAVPQTVSGLPAGGVAIAAGGNHTVELLDTGLLKAWGDNALGQLGNGRTTNAPVPVTVAGLGGTPTGIVAGDAHSLALLGDGSLQSWGFNNYGQLGSGTVVSVAAPQTVAGLGGSVTAIAAGSGFSAVVLDDGTVRCWGYNNYGQLGNGTTTNSLTPVSVSGLGGTVSAIAAGTYHTLALMGDGTVKAWGNNGSGQLGNGSYTSSSLPVTVSGLSGQVTAIAAGYNFSLALLADGTVMAWGLNGSGQLGNGSYTTSPTPVAVGSLGGVATAIAAGAYHGAALLSDGTVKTWGNNGAGQLGIGTTIGNPLPQTVSSLGGAASAIAAGDSHTVALLSDGSVKGWGDNSAGQLGTGTTTNSLVPVSVSGLGGTVTALAAGDYHTVVLLANGSLQAWGRNGHGQLGDGMGPVAPQSVAVNLDNLPPLVSVDNPGGTYTSSVQVSLACADGFSGCNGIYYTTDGSVPTWPVTGTTQLYQAALTMAESGSIRYLALDRAGNVSAVTTQNYSITPATYPLTITFAGSGSGVVRLSSGGICTTGCSQSIIVGAQVMLVPGAAARSRFVGWTGCDTVAGAVCNVTMTASKSVTATFDQYPVGGAIAVAGGAYHSVAVQANGSVQAWGDNGQGQLGNGSTTSSTVPVTVTGLAGQVVDVAVGAYHTVALLADGTVQAWGNNSFGQLGNGTTTASSQPVTVTGLGGTVTAIAAGAYHTLALMADGTVKAWGDNSEGQLGNGSTVSSSIPVTVTGLGAQPVAIAADGANSLALLASGAVQAWGYNNYGQLGNGSTVDSATPVTVTGLGGAAVAIANGYYHTLALMADGTVKAWGYNYYGQLGNGGTNSSLTPVTVTGLDGVAAISAGANHSLAMKADGSVQTWGLNTSGQLGNGSVSNSALPVTVSGLTNASAVGAGITHSLALRADGTVVAWGLNANGQLGNGTLTNSSTPVPVGGVVVVCNVKIGETCFASLAAAYAAASDGAALLARGIAFAESFTADRQVSVTIRGGYQADFMTRSGVTTITGLTVSAGALESDALTVQ
jgi:alpha-tubulin suppressor-like RCC1 family protein